MSKCSNWSLQLLKISTSKTAGTKYASRQIQLEPASEMVSFISEISKKYLSRGKGSLDSYTDIVDYDGTASGTTIYKLDKENTLIASEYDAFLTEIANPDVEADPFAYTSAYVIKGIIPIPVSYTHLTLPTT